MGVIKPLSGFLKFSLKLSLLFGHKQYKGVLGESVSCKVRRRIELGNGFMAKNSHNNDDQWRLFNNPFEINEDPKLEYTWAWKPTRNLNPLRFK